MLSITEIKTFKNFSSFAGELYKTLLTKSSGKLYIDKAIKHAPNQFMCNIYDANGQLLDLRISFSKVGELGIIYGALYTSNHRLMNRLNKFPGATSMPEQLADMIIHVINPVKIKPKMLKLTR